MKVYTPFLLGTLMVVFACSSSVNSDQQVETYDGYSNSRECANVAIEGLDKYLKCNGCMMSGNNLTWCFTVDSPIFNLQWSLCIHGNNFTYAGNGSKEDLDKIYPNIRNTEIEDDTGLLYIPSVGSELAQSTFNCTVFDFDDLSCGQNKSFVLEVLTRINLQTPPSIITLQVGTGTQMESISVSTSSTIKVDIGKYNFFCINGETTGKNMLPMWTLGNASVQAISLYQLNMSLLRDVNQCVSCNCVGTFFRTKYLYSLLEYSQMYGTLNASAFVVFGYSGSPSDVKHYRCTMLPNLFMSFLITSDVGLGAHELEFDITTFKNRPARKSYTVEFDFFQGDPVFLSPSSSQQIQQHSNAFFICNASTSVNASLLWKISDTLIEQKNPPSDQQTDELITLVFIKELCVMFAPAKVFFINLYHNRVPKNESDYTIVLNQLSILLVCNAEQSDQGEYQCFASNSSKGGPTARITVERSKKIVIVVSIVTIMSVVVVVVLLIGLIILCGCLRARRMSSEPIQMKPLRQKNQGLNNNIDSAEFPRTDLTLDKVLGEGQFGVVRKAYANGICSYDRNRQVVAVKTLKRNATPADKDDLKAELEIMKNMEPHPNIINFLGQCSETASDSLFILMEFAVFGSLKDYLKSIQDGNVPTGRCGNESITDQNKTEHCLCRSSTNPSSAFTNPAAVAHASRLLRLLNSESYATKLEDSEPDCVLPTESCVHRTCLDDYPYWIDAPTQNEYYNAYHSQSQVSPDDFSTNSCVSNSMLLPPYINSPTEENDGSCTQETFACLYHNVPQSLVLSSETSARGTQSACNTINTGTTSDKYLSYFDILDFAYQIARGMEHLEKMKCVHRDLAARNVLIAEGFLMKVGDFGLARNLSETDYYRKITSGRVPARWMAIESLEERKHTSKSDVWSYGVLLWEIFTYGKLPYGREPFASSIERLCSYISCGNRLQRPDFCSNEMYSILTMCWHATPEERPSFSQLISFFKTLLDSSQNFFGLSIQDAAFQPELQLQESAALCKVFSANCMPYNQHGAEIDNSQSLTRHKIKASPDSESCHCLETSV